MGHSIYFGKYLRFETLSKKQGVQLTNADNLVGDIYDIEFKIEEGEYVAWMKNRFDAHVGYFDKANSRTLKLMDEQGWVISALLAYVAYTDHPQPGIYWGEAAVIAHDSRQEAFLAYTEKLSARLAEGIRPEIALGVQGVSKVIESQGAWSPSNTLPPLKSKHGTAFLKTKRSMSERLIERGRSKNRGCYFATFLVFLIIFSLLFFVVRFLGVF